MTEDDLRTYLEAAAAAPVLTTEEERLLLDAAGRGDAEARNQLQTSNARLVIAIAQRSRDSGLSLETLVEAGSAELARSIDRFSFDKRVRLIEWATWWIRQAISRKIGGAGRRPRTWWRR